MRNKNFIYVFSLDFRLSRCDLGREREGGNEEKRLGLGGL